MYTHTCHSNYYIPIHFANRSVTESENKKAVTGLIEHTVYEGLLNLSRSQP